MWDEGESGAGPVAIATASRAEERRECVSEYSLWNRWDVRKGLCGNLSH